MILRSHHLILFDLATTFNTFDLSFLFKILIPLNWPSSLYSFLSPPTSWLLHHYVLNKYGLLTSASKYWIGMSSVYTWCLSCRCTLLRSRKKVWTEYRGAQIYVLSKFNIQKFLEWNILSFSMMLAVWISKYSHPSPWLLLFIVGITNLIYSSIVSSLY